MKRAAVKRRHQEVGQKSRNDGNLIVCGAPARAPDLIVCGAPSPPKPNVPNPPKPNLTSLPRPPDPNGSAPSPSLLKALEAVVEAGRRGLLGPAAKVAAAAAKPNWNGGNSSRVVCQEAQNLIPLVAGQTTTERKTETINKEYGTVIPLEPEGVKNPQATSKEIWICGNSVVLKAKKRANIRPHGWQLGVPASYGCIYWHGMQAMMWDQLVPLLHEMYQIRSCPSIIIIHLGENDLLPDNCTSLIIKIKNDLGILSRAFADTTLVWSSLLPRRFGKEGQAPAILEKALKFVNSKMAKYCSEIGTYFLSHDLITSDRPSLYLPDSNDLSDEGNDLFIEDLKKVLKFILDVKD